MSEQTGATDEQIEAAVERALHARAWMPCQECGLGAMHWAAYLVPPGYRIVPADAVVVAPEIAATAADACEDIADNWFFSAKATAAGGDEDNTNRYLDNAKYYRAAAAALRGEG